MEESIVRVENLSHRYSVQWAIKDICFDISSNGIYGLLGSNGAGKSTTMNIMCGVLKPTGGDVFIKGVSMKEDPIGAKCNLGFLPQKPPLNPEMTIEEYLLYCAHVRWLDGKVAEDAVNEVLERCGITHFRKRLIRNLSGGYQQRVGIAQAIVHNPALVVLDEPTNGLDPNQIVEIRNLIKEIAEERTVIFSSHILTEVKATCDYIRMIEQGQLVFSGTVDEFDNYITPDSLFVSLAGMPDPEELKKLEGVVDVEPLAGSNYRIHFRDANTAIDNLVEKSVSNHWLLREVRVEKSSLDTIFAELSKKS